MNVFIYKRSGYKTVYISGELRAYTRLSNIIIRQRYIDSMFVLCVYVQFFFIFWHISHESALSHLAYHMQPRTRTFSHTQTHWGHKYCNVNRSHDAPIFHFHKTINVYLTIPHANTLTHIYTHTHRKQRARERLFANKTF